MRRSCEMGSSAFSAAAGNLCVSLHTFLQFLWFQKIKNIQFNIIKCKIIQQNVLEQFQQQLQNLKQFCYLLMKFTHSERVFHDIKYNPPCNYYNIDKKPQKIILHGSLAGPVLISNDKNTFGYDKRFQSSNRKTQAPGPGQYFNQKKQIVYEFKKDLTNPKQFLKSTAKNQQKNPSIPFKVLSQDNLDQEDKKFLKQLSLIQNPARAAEKIHKKQPSYSFSKSPRKLLPQIANQKKQKQNSANVFSQQLQKIQQRAYTQIYRPPRQQNQNSQSGKKKQIIYNETIKKATQKRNQIINKVGPDFIPSLELIDLMSKLRTKYTPGPGSYNANNSSFDSEIEKFADSNKKGAIFSAVKRFNVDKKNLLGPGTYETNYESFSKKGGLMSKEKRLLFNMKQNTDISHRFYIDPNCQSKITPSRQAQRSSSCASLKKKINQESQLFNALNAFGSSSKRFSTALSTNQDDKRSQMSDYEVQKKKQFKVQLKNRIKKLNSEDRRSTKQDSGLLGIQSMASNID